MYIIKKNIINVCYMSGGLIHKISNQDLIANRNPKLYSDDERKYIELISIKHDSLIEPIGSFTYEIQKYPSDIDINQTVKIRNNNFKMIAKHFREIAVNIMKSKLVYFSDLKLGLDIRYPDDRDKFIIRWSIPEIILGYKVLPQNKILKLEDALQMKAPIKLDIIAFTDNRFIEASTFFILEKVNDDGTTEFVNIPADFFERFKDELKREVLKYIQLDTLKYFKAVKRMWSLARVNKDFKMLKRLEPLINSNLSLLGQINADIETLELLFEKASALPIHEMILTINSIGKRLSTIVDIKLDDNFLVDKLDKIKLLLNNYDGDSKKVEEELTKLHDYILNVMNKETSEYMKLHRLLPIPKDYLPNYQTGLLPGKGILGNLTKKAYQKLVNEYRKRYCNGKARQLEFGEIHPLCANYEGPGTRIDLHPKTPPFNNIDNCSRIHDLKYEDIKKEKDLIKKALMIQKADQEAIDCFNQYPNEEPYYTLGKLGLTGKLTLDKIVSALKGKPQTIYGGKKKYKKNRK